MTTPLLFPEAQPPQPARPEGPFAKVAIEQTLDKVLDYAIPAGLRTQLHVGQRVVVPLGRGNKPTHGYVVAIVPTTEYPKIKPVLAIDDERILISPQIMELSLWMSRYYCAPLGSVLESVIPSAVKKRIGLDYTPMVRLAQPRQQVQALLEKTKARKRRAILARLLLLEPDQAVALPHLAGEAGTTPATVRKLARLGLISIVSEPDYVAFSGDPALCSSSDAVVPELNEDQAAVMASLSPRIASSSFSVNLIYGVTGSGKTEIYLRCLKQVIDAGGQAIVLVPEIALTPQTVHRFTARFPKVAVLHSGLNPTQRHRFWQQIAQGQADVVVGARSGVFAPMPRLGIIVVDEEHESSYKQDTAPRYHARDVAIKRAQLEKIPVLLGSATPSLESYSRAIAPSAALRAQAEGSGEITEARRHGNAEGEGEAPSIAPDSANPQSAIPNPQSTRDQIQNPPSDIRPPYHLLSLPRRVRGLSLPTVELIDMKLEALARRPGIHLISRKIEHMLRTTLVEKHQAILLLNRRGYASFIYCVSCAEPIHCKYCDVTMTYHRSAGEVSHSSRASEAVHSGQLHCHYCLAVNSLPDKCPTCGKKLSLFGLGTQRVEEELTRKFPELKYARVDSDTMRSARDYESILAQFARGDLQVLLGTQMIAKGLDYPNVTLVGVISGDTALALPDFRAAERTFQLITQVAGRAGRGDAAGRVIVQTYQPDNPVLRLAIQQDYETFARQELAQRREVGLPPAGRLVRIVLRDEDLDKLHTRSQTLAAALSAELSANPTVQLKGPMPCAINRIAGHHRAQILLQAPSAAALQSLLAGARAKSAFSSADRIAVDVDPVSLL